MLHALNKLLAEDSLGCVKTKKELFYVIVLCTVRLKSMHNKYTCCYTHMSSNIFKCYVKHQGHCIKNLWFNRNIVFKT